MTYVALLRGINVGGKNKLPMQDLIQIFSAAGCHDVRTYIQSGNVLFDMDAGLAPHLPNMVTARIQERFGYRVPLVLRTTSEIQGVIVHNPFVDAGSAEDMLHVLFLADQPSAESVAALDPDRSPPDAFIVQDREIYLRLPNGAARTKLTNAYFDAKLATISTGRNWRTVITLLALMQR